MGDLNHLQGQLVIGAILFALGAIGFLTRRNLILMMLSVELMLHGVSVNLTAFGHYHGTAAGQAFTIFVLTISACEAGIALSLILSLYQRRKSLDINLWSQLGEPDLPRLAQDVIEPPAAPATEEWPHLTKAGRAPMVTPIKADYTVGSKN